MCFNCAIHLGCGHPDPTSPSNLTFRSARARYRYRYRYRHNLETVVACIVMLDMRAKPRVLYIEVLRVVCIVGVYCTVTKYSMVYYWKLLVFNCTGCRLATKNFSVMLVTSNTSNNQARNVGFPRKCRLHRTLGVCYYCGLRVSVSM